MTEQKLALNNKRIRSLAAGKRALGDMSDKSRVKQLLDDENYSGRRFEKFLGEENNEENTDVASRTGMNFLQTRL
jgi:hypothetical protein